MDDIKGLFVTYKGLYIISKNGIIVVTLFVAKFFVTRQVVRCLELIVIFN
jgi:hypothetical protein